MANSVGLIDAGYRGTLLGVTDFNSSYTVTAGDRYYQIVAADLLPWAKIHIVEDIPGGPTLRGAGGFGSTGRTFKCEPTKVFHEIPPVPTTAQPQEVQFRAETSTVQVAFLNPNSYFNA
jgi:hypothetical protein